VIDLKALRAGPEVLRAALIKRGGDDRVEVVDELLALDEKRRAGLAEVNELKAHRNEVSKKVGEMKRAGDNADDVIAEMKTVGLRISQIDNSIAEAEVGIRELALQIPNPSLEEVPAGGEEDNVLVRSWGEPSEADFARKPHWDLGESLDILDLPRGAKLSGSGFPVLKGVGARLQRGLIDFMLDIHTQEHGYTEMRVPYLVNSDSLRGTGQLPKFADDTYQSERDDLWLIPTAEVPMTNLHRDELLDAEDLPIQYTAYSPCFRREAGAAGKDTRGLLRVHQFDKVELVRFERPEDSRDVLEVLTGHAEVVLQRLGLPYRVLLLATGDLGFSSAMTYDLEVWAPGVEQWLEVSSASTFTDFQARRANIRYRPAPNEKPRFVHTLNASGVALPRLMVALLETYQQADGSVCIPRALQPYVGFEEISA
jgi:seryl-tRNA synthetase